MDTPVLDNLNVTLAYRLGDPLDADNQPVSYSTDGLVYSARMRELLITEGLRIVLNTLGHSFNENFGYIQKYTQKQDGIQAFPQPFPLPEYMQRVLYVEWQGRMCLPMTFVHRKKKAHLLWQRVPQWEIDTDLTGAKILRIENMDPHMELTGPIGGGPGIQIGVASPLYQVTVIYLRVIPDLEHGGSEDVMLPDVMFPLLLSTAEYLGRRNHQEFTVALQKIASDQAELLKQGE